MSSEIGKALDDLLGLLLGLPAEAGDADSQNLAEEARAIAMRVGSPGTPKLPDIVLLFGPSGSGKSTLFNAVFRSRFSETSSIERPSTRGAIVALHHSRRADLEKSKAFAGFSPFVMGDGPGTGHAGRIAYVEHRLDRFRDVMLIDCPDFDTDLSANRLLGERLLGWADAVVFVTSEERYADRASLPYLTRLHGAGQALLTIVNRLSSLRNEGPAKGFSQVLHLAGWQSPNPSLAIATQAREGLPRDPEVERLREFIVAARDQSTWIRRARSLVAHAREFSKHLEPLAHSRTEHARRLDKLAKGSAPFEIERELRAVARYENDTRPGLRYSTRGTISAFRRYVKFPRTFFDQAPALPESPRRERIESSILTQVESAIEGIRVAAQESMKFDSIGRRALAAAPPRELHLDRSQLARIAAPLVDRLHRFSETVIRKFQETRGSRDRSLVQKTAFWALDRALQMLVLASTVAVLPPLVFELLSRARVEGFFSEVEAEYTECRNLFRDIVNEAASHQILAFSAALDRHVLRPTFLDEWRAAIDRLERLLPEG